MAATMEKTRHPGIFKRGSRYVIVWRDQNGRQRKESCATLADARAEKGRRDSGDRMAVERMRFDEYARDWIESYGGRTRRGLTGRTRIAYRRAIENRAVPFFGRSKLGAIGPPDVRRFVASMEAEGLSPSTVRGEVAPLRAMFATALEDGALRSNPTVGVRVNGRRDHEEDERPRAFTRAELSALLAELPEGSGGGTGAEGTDWRLFFELLAHTGLRVSEALGLRWGAVEFGERPCVHVQRQCIRGEWSQPKSAKSLRKVPLSPGMARRLWRLRGTRGARAGGASARGSRGERGAEGLVFPSQTGTPLRDGNIRRRVLWPAAERAGVRWAGFHTFRHTCASLLFEHGKNVAQVAAWLGHADPAFTLRTYVHLMDDGLGETAFLDGLVPVGGNEVATQAPETSRNDEPAEPAFSAS